MFKKVLVANRGEIAVRIIRACRDLGLRTVAVYSEVDKEAPHVHLADEAHLIGGAQEAKSYLDMAALMRAVTDSGADAIHPGYGFLSENHRFAEVCRAWGITFIGPDPGAIEEMGVKARAKERMRAAGVPVAPGSDGTLRDPSEAAEVARRIGYPVLVKASAGGGGRGIRVVHDEQELAQAMERAAAEAQAYFGDGQLYLEKYLPDPRHIEIQVLADAHGRVASLGERESSMQRRRQKILEEAPAVPVDAALRRRMGEAAAKAAAAVGYKSAGTVEFLLDRDGSFYFMEMNTRVQVEHPCTELVTGVDIVAEQLRVAMGEPLDLPEAVEPSGWAVECRVNAEDPERNFLPCPGTITAYEAPGGPWVRVDSGVSAGSVVSPFYDSLLAKVITWGRDRTQALDRMRRALQEFRVEGITTTIPLHLKLLEDPDFRRGEYHINFLEQRFGQP
ncbi:MAG: acetyl-CoA carboxylase biotin carboxylase subunit [Thermaerobacter sp.]|nr:acetyl-CoA carboxylase biotin carboxylase subunit [Thermaerobacter sp.]